MAGLTVTPHTQGAIIGGKEVGAARADAAMLCVTDPEDGREVGLVPACTEEDADAALAAAETAAAGVRAMPAHARAELLAGVAADLAADAEAFAELIATEGIKTIREARREVARAVETLRLSAAACKAPLGEVIAFDQAPHGVGRSGHVLRVPVGPVLAITPFNDPLNLVAHKVGPAIAAGNPVILLPHEATPLTALRLAALFLGRGGGAMFQVVTGRGRDIGDQLVASPVIRMVSFTGGAEVGAHVLRTAGLKRVALELGGICPTIIAADADLDRAVAACVSGAFWAAGQNCLHVQRVIVEAPVFDAVRDRMVVATAALKTGPKRLPTTDMGCLISDAAAEATDQLVAHAMAAGARRLAGGDRRGTCYPPTLLEAPGAPLIGREVFAPVTELICATDFDDALRLANDPQSGLQAGVFTGSLDRARHAVDRLNTGAVMVNDSSDFRIDAMPFGGVGASGLGREGIASAVASMSELKLACFA